MTKLQWPYPESGEYLTSESVIARVSAGLPLSEAVQERIIFAFQTPSQRQLAKYLGLLQSRCKSSCYSGIIRARRSSIPARP
jgi:hypothetical protein